MAEKVRALNLAVGSRHPVEFRNAPDHAEPQRQRHFGNRLAVNAWRSAHSNSVGLCGFQVDVVEPDTLLGNDPQLFGAHHVFGGNFLAANHQSVGVFVPIFGSWVVPPNDLRLLFGQFDAAQVKCIEHIDFHSTVS